MFRVLLALFLALPLVLAPVISARAHGGAEGCVTTLSKGEQHSGHMRAPAARGHEGHHKPAPEQKRVAAMPCCLTVCPGLVEVIGPRLSGTLSVKDSSRLTDEFVAGRALEPAKPPPRSHS